MAPAPLPRYSGWTVFSFIWFNFKSPINGQLPLSESEVQIETPFAHVFLFRADSVQSKPKCNQCVPALTESSFLFWSARSNGAVFIDINFSTTGFTPAVALKPLGGGATAKKNTSSYLSFILCCKGSESTSSALFKWTELPCVVVLHIFLFLITWNASIRSFSYCSLAIKSGNPCYLQFCLHLQP